MFVFQRFRATFVHLGLIAACTAYIVIGAQLFQAIERPFELEMNKKALTLLEEINSDFMTNINDPNLDVDDVIDFHIENMLLFFENSHYSHVFKTTFTNYTAKKDIWTFPAAVLFTTTTIIPVGYGNVCPNSQLGRILLIIYGVIGIPLAFITIADAGKFLSQNITVCLNESMARLTVLFLSLLCFYPVLGGVLFHYYADLQLRDAIYFSFTSIFTIGFGDLMPNINVFYLVVFIIFGVILVTITIEFVAAEAIDRIHYMGRHVGKARIIAGKIMQLGNLLNVNRGFTGLSSSVYQLQALARFGSLGKQGGKSFEKCADSYAFAPFLDMDFVDNVPESSPE
ncbi:Ion channel [Dictyocaulus viviparus]|uniref:Ion channel n=1 Tax=Dictyocaulus viviparus TaxID=29172 RepID=A0A0D8Y7L1_DICVI|nr:Ion channel [Dictyocaulus viviparus]